MRERERERGGGVFYRSIGVLVQHAYHLLQNEFFFQAVHFTLLKSFTNRHPISPGISHASLCEKVIVHLKNHSRYTISASTSLSEKSTKF